MPILPRYEKKLCGTIFMHIYAIVCWSRDHLRFSKSISNEKEAKNEQIVPIISHKLKRIHGLLHIKGPK